MEEAWEALRATEGTGKRGLGSHLPWKKQRKLWEGMTKAQCSLFTQVRTGHIGLRDYLFSRKVPNVIIPWCECGDGRETPLHIIKQCMNPDLLEAAGPRPPTLANLRTQRDLQLALEDPDTTMDILRWLMATGRLSEFDLARRLDSARGAAMTN